MTASETGSGRVVALVVDAERVARLRAAFGGGCRVLQSASDLIAVSRSAPAELVIVPPRDVQGRPLPAVVAAIRASRRSPPVYVYTDRSIESVHELMPLARAGARGVIVAGVDDDSMRLRRLLGGGSIALAVESITMTAHEVIKPRYAPLVLRCLEHIDSPLTADDFARSLHVSRRTLTSWANSAGARGIRALTSRCRVLVAIEMLRDSRRSVEQTALDLRFSSSAHLHNTIRRYTGLRPRQGVTRDSAAWFEVLFPAACVRRPPQEESRPPPAEWPAMPNGATLRSHQAMPGEQ